MSEKMNYLGNKQKAHEYFLGGVKGIGIPKFVDPGYQPTERELLGERLKTFPEMDEFWEFFFECSFLQEPRMITRFMLLPESIVDFGYKYLQSSTLPETVPSSQRRSTATKIAKHAKRLRREIEEMGLPESVFFYLPRDYIQRLLKNFILELGTELPDADFFSFVMDDPTYQRTADEIDIHIRLQKVIDEYASKLSLSHPYEHEDAGLAFGISGILNALKNEDAVVRCLPDVTVQRSTPRTKMRLALIRRLSRWLYQTHHEDPMQRRNEIAAVSRAILDDEDLGEDTVKDALHGFNYRSRSPGN